MRFSPSAVFVWIALSVALGATTAHAQSLGKQDFGDPARCVAILEDFGDVGLRISDAQSVAETVLVHFRKRTGKDGIVYAGFLKSAVKLKKMLGPNAETRLQDEQIAYAEAATKAASWRIRARFGKAGKRQWITAACKKVGSDAVVHEVRVEGATFLEARDAMVAAMPTFCPAIKGPADTAMQIPIEGATNADGTAIAPAGTPQDGEPAWARKKKKPSEGWTPPPLRP